VRFLGLSVLLFVAGSAAGANYTTYSIFDLQQQAPPYGNAYYAVPGPMTFGALVADSNGNLYTGGRQIWKILGDGLTAPFAGFGSAVLYPGDRTPALLAAGFFVTAATLDASGNMFIASGPIGPNSYTSPTLYRVTPDGLMQLYIPTPASWTLISGLSTDAVGNLYVLVSGGPLVKIAPDLTMTTVAQISGNSMVGDSAGNQSISDFANNRILKVDTTGAVSTVTEVSGPQGLARDPQGNLYVSQPNLAMVVRIAPDGTVTPVAGNGTALYSGDGGPATQAGLMLPADVAVDPAGNVYIGDLDNGRIRKVDTNGIIRTLAGCGCGPDGVPVSWAKAGSPLGVAADAGGNIYFSDTSQYVVRKIAPDGTITTVAGNGEPGSSGDNGPATGARLTFPTGLAVDAAGNLYIADEQANRIRKVTPGGIIQTVAGNGVSGFGGDGGPAAAAMLAFPDGVAADAAGNLYIADTASHRIRKVTPDGIIHTIGGSDQPGLAGDGGAAAQALLFNPRMLALDPKGDLLFTDTAENVVRMITPQGMIQRVAGTGQAGDSGDGGPATAAAIGGPWGLAVDAAGDIFVGDMSAGGKIREVNTSGIISTVTGGVAKGLAVDAAGRIWWGSGANTDVGGNLLVASENGLPFPLAPVIFDNGVTGAAMLDTAAVAPGEIVSIYGDHLGPATPASATVSGGMIANTLAGVQVLFGGVPAPVLYASVGQINAVVPFAVAGATTDVTVEYNRLTSNAAKIGVLPAVPQLFPGALNQDGTINATFNPAMAGSIITLWGTGAGLMNPPQTDGQITATVLATPLLTTGITAAAVPFPVTYAGAAPDIVAGGIQINVQLPDNVLTGYYSLALRVGNAISGQGIVETQAKQ
jgi:uncharacterized protein (TIGR03437 family)